MRRPAWSVTLSVSALSAAVVWAIAVPVTGHSEPWDAPGPYYPVALAIAGLLAGLLSPRVLWAYLVGAVVGQLLYEIAFLRMGPLVLVGALFMTIYSLVFFGAAVVASYARLRILSGRGVPPNKSLERTRDR